MFKYDLSYINLIHLSKVSVNEKKLKITYFWDGRIESQTFADNSEFDEAVDAVVEAGLLLIGETYYNKDRLSIVIPNGKNCSFLFIGNVIINHAYEDVSEVEDVIAEIEPQFIEINGKWYQGKQIHVAKANELTLTISYDYLGMDWFDVTYEDQAAFDEAIEKLANIGEGGGGSGTKKVKTPVLSPRGGEVDAGTTVTITCGTEGATIHYTTDGSDPTASSPTYSSPIAITGDMTIKAFAVKTDMKDSSVVTGTYTIATERVAAPTFSPSAGAVEIGTTITLACATDGAEIHYTTDNSTPDASSPVYDGTPIEITAAMTIKAIGIKEGWDNSNVSTAAYTIVKVATPTFSPAAGEVESGTEVTINCATVGAEIHYTTDGTTPDSSSPVYSTPIEITAATTIKAMAVKANCTDSEVATAEYTIHVVLYRYAGWITGDKPIGYYNPNKAMLEGMEDLQKDTLTGASSPESLTFTATQVCEDDCGRPTWAYPSSYGPVTEFKDGLGWHPINEAYTLKTCTVDGVEYNCYIMTTYMVPDVGDTYNWPFRA